MVCTFRLCLAALVLVFCARVATSQDEPPPLNVFNGEIPKADNIYFVAPDGDNGNPGTITEPFATLNHAVTQVLRGDVIVMRGGVYHHNATISIQTPSGFFDEMITLTAYPGEVPILDFSNQPMQTNNHGVRLNANFWHVIGITIRYASHNGIRTDGSYNVLEQMTAYGNHDTGIHMAGGASNNLVKNSDSFHNFNFNPDLTPNIGNNADGFSAKFVIGTGNRFYGCRAWENSDDGFDFWEAPNQVVVENSWSFGNGDASIFGNPEGFQGNGNGFKLGGNQVHVGHVVRRSVAFDNFGVSGNAKGFDFNNNWGAMRLEHNTAFNNGRNFWFPATPPDGKQHVFLNNLGFQSANQNAIVVPGSVEAGNSWQVDQEISAAMFESLDTAAAKGPRQPDGSLPDIGLLRLTPGSFLVDGGVAFGQPYYGLAPDIGAFDYVHGGPVQPWIDLGSTDLIASLRVFDMEAGELWSIRDDFGTGAPAYQDGDAVIASISGKVNVDEWIQTASGTGPKNYLFTVADLEVSQHTSLMIAHAADITPKPEWLASFEAADATITLTASGQDHVLTVYQKAITPGETVILGRNSRDGDVNAPMYLAMLGSIGPISVDDEPLAAAAVELHQNYPNPFASSTVVSFSLPSATHVSLKVYDLTGREVADLAHDLHDAGTHSIHWAPQNLSNGVYHLRLVADGAVETRRVVLVR